MATWDLLIVGGGYWGAAVSFEARKKGWRVAVVDDGDKRSGTRAASGVADRSAFKSEVFRKYLPVGWSDSDLDDSFNWLLERGGETVGEYFWNRFAGTGPREGSECVYIEGPETITNLLGSTYRGRFDPSKVDYKRLVVAAGYRTDEVLAQLGLDPLGVGKLYGRGIVAEGTPSLVTPVSVMIRPYCKHTVRRWGSGQWKVGDTAEKIPNEKYLESLREVGRSVLSDYREVKVSEGFRPILPKFTVEKLTPSIVVATGGHRLGLGLAGLVAKKVMEMFR